MLNLEIIGDGLYFETEVFNSFENHATIRIKPTEKLEKMLELLEKLINLHQTRGF